ncbi:MAG TPA: spore coat U domain-containing protein [Burkholderiales bacterium]
MRKQLIHAAALLAGAALSFQCFAQAVLTVSATVTETCLLTSGALAFGGYSGSAVTGTGTITATCTNGSAAKIMMGQGANPASGSTDTAPLRQMQIGTTGKYLSYFLYSAGPNNTVWGNTTATAKILSATGLVQTVNVDGTIPAGQTPSAGVYTDVVNVTFTF